MNTKFQPGQTVEILFRSHVQGTARVRSTSLFGGEIKVTLDNGSSWKADGRSWSPLERVYSIRLAG